MGIMKKFFNQTRKPEGTLGKIMLSSMNSGHAKMVDWGISYLPELNPSRIVELGCGAGRSAGELLKKYPTAHVTAIDYSLLSVEKTRAYNRTYIDAGRCIVQQADISDLRFPEESFDLATAFETVYFWPGIEKCFARVSKALRPGAYFLICNESDGFDATGKKFEKIIDGMKVYKTEELEATLRKAGFAQVSTDHHGSKPWITVLARK